MGGRRNRKEEERRGGQNRSVKKRKARLEGGDRKRENNWVHGNRVKKGSEKHTIGRLGEKKKVKKHFAVSGGTEESGEMRK